MSVTGGFSQCAAAPLKHPNIVIILADDMGFSDPGCYGGEIHTPNLDKLASNGLRFTQFYNCARCWPTRSALMSGYYAQQVRMDPPSGPLPAWARLIPQYLKPLGYRCYHSGKWHVSGAPKPCADAGFDHSYLFEDWDRYFTPSKHFEDDKRLPPVQPGDGYYATTAFTDHAIKYLKDHGASHKGDPFFLYLAYISPHFPLHALPQDIAEYKDVYKAGWDKIREARWKRLKEMGIVTCDLSPLDQKLSPRYFKTNVMEQLGPGEERYAVPWDSLTQTQKDFQAIKFSLHAAMVDRMDQEIGRVVEQLKAMGVFEDTVIFFLSDNGADATLMIRGEGHDPAAPPGSAKSFLAIGPGWASASNAPFRRHKVWVSEGGISTPLIIHWPNGIKARGKLRRDMGHVIDFAPTVIDLAGGTLDRKWHGLTAPPFPGESLVPAFAKDHALKTHELFFDHEGNRSLRSWDWKLVSAREDDNQWQLFDLGTDRCEKHDLATKYPKQAAELELRWTELEKQYRADAGPSSEPSGKKKKKKQVAPE